MSEILPNARVIVPNKHGRHIRFNNNEVQKYPFLWDPREKDYRDVDQKKTGVGKNKKGSECSKW